MKLSKFQHSIIERLRNFCNEMEFQFCDIDHDDESVEICIKNNPISAFTYRIYVPHDNDNRILGCLTVKTESFMFDGDRSDLNMLISFFASLFLKVSFNYNIYISFVEHPVNDMEIYGSRIIAQDKNIFDISNENDYMELQGFIMNVLLLDLALGKTFKLDKDSNLINDYDDCLFEALAKVIYGHSDRDKYLYNCNARKNDDWYFFHDYNNWVTIFKFKNPIFSTLHSYINKFFTIERIEGIDNYILLQGAAMNVANKEKIMLAEKILNYMFDNDFSFIKENFSYYAIDNYIFVMSQSTLICINDDCSHRRAEDEKSLIKERQQRENSLLFPALKITWSAKIDDDRFEEMIRELLNKEPYIVKTRKVGSSREGDGGRDIEIEMLMPRLFTTSGDETSLKTVKIIGQCKAYKQSVNKNNVRDIRDTLDFYNAQGYFLAVSSQITVPLHGYLSSLREKNGYYIDWWNRAEVEDRLRVHTDIALRYSDIVSIEK